MPEGDTVWNTAHALHEALAGQQLTGSDLRVPRLATVDLAGWTVRESTCRGKHLLLRLTRARGAGAEQARTEQARTEQARTEQARTEQARTEEALTLHSHLRMDGEWRVFRPGRSWGGRPAHLVRAVLRTGTAVAVGFHLHDLVLVATGREGTLVDHLGPDLLGADWDPAEAVRRLAAQPDRPIGDALLDQRNLAGIGNLYKCELLFLRGVSPWTKVADTPDLPALVDLAHRLLTANRGRWTQSTTGSLYKGQTSYVYGRRAQPCRRCGSPVRKDEHGERVTYWCPACQPYRDTP